MNVKDIRPLRNEVIIRKSDINLSGYESKILELKEDRTGKMNAFEVVVVSDKCKVLKVGDIIGIPFNQHTVPIEIDGVMYAAVSEDDVWFVIER